MSIYRCFYIDGNDRVWFDLICEDNTVKICTVSRENISRGRKISRYYDIFLRKIVVQRGRYIECYSFELRSIKIRIIGRRKVNEHLYVILEMKPFKNRVYVPLNKIDLLKKCISG